MIERIYNGNYLTRLDNIIQWQERDVFQRESVSQHSYKVSIFCKVLLDECFKTENVEVLKEVVRVKVEQKDEIIKKEYPLSEIKILKDNKKKDEEIENIKELKGLEEGFKRTDDII